MTEAKDRGIITDGEQEGALPQPSVKILFSYGFHIPETFIKVEELSRTFFQKESKNYLLLESGKPLPNDWDFNQERSLWGSYKKAIVAVILRSMWSRKPGIEEVERFSEEDFDKIKSKMGAGNTCQEADLADKLEREGYSINIQFESAPAEESRRSVQIGKEKRKAHREALEYALRGNYKKAAKRMGTTLTRIAFDAKQRNKRFIDQVVELVEKAKNQSQENRILVRFGSSHPEISQATIEKYQNEDNVSIVVQYDDENQPLPLPDILIRKYYDGKIVTDTELARVVLYDIFMEERSRNGEASLFSTIEISNTIAALDDQKVHKLFAKLAKAGIEGAKAEIGLW